MVRFPLFAFQSKDTQRERGQDRESARAQERKSARGQEGKREELVLLIPRGQSVGGLFVLCGPLFAFQFQGEIHFGSV